MRRRAFTLVELIIVMGILICLMSIMLPVLVRVRENGRRVKCLSNLRVLTTAWLSNVGDNDRLLYGGTASLGKFVVPPDANRCPSDRDPPNIKPVSYQMNGVLTGSVLNPGPRKLDDLTSPSTTFVYIEGCNPVSITLSGPFNTPIYPQFFLKPKGWPGQNHKGVKAAAEGTGISFADGHAIFWQYTDPRIGNSVEAAWAPQLSGPKDPATGWPQAWAPNSADIFQLEVWSGGPVPPGTVTDWLRFVHPEG